MKNYYIFFLGLLAVVLLFFFLMYNPVILCEGDSDKIIEIAEQSSDRISGTIINSGVNILEGGNSVESVMNFLYFNLFISICMFFSAILLFYFFKKDINRLIIITVIFLDIFGSISYYLAFNLYGDIRRMSIIYYSVINPYSEINRVELINDILDSSIIISICILIISSLFMGMYINYKVIYRNWNILLLKRIIGEGFYRYFMKIYNYGSKTSLWWMYFCLFLLVFFCSISILIGSLLIVEIDEITKLYDIF